MTERVLSGQFQIIGFLMAVAYATPLVLSCAYPMYGEACCKTLKDEEVPDSEENVQETRKVDYVVLVIAILHWGVIFLGIVFILLLHGGDDWSSDVGDDWNHVFETENLTTTAPAANAS